MGKERNVHCPTDWITLSSVLGALSYMGLRLVRDGPGKPSKATGVGQAVRKGVAEGTGLGKCAVRRWSDTGFTYLKVCHVSEGLSLFCVIPRDHIKIKRVETLKRQF